MWSILEKVFRSLINEPVNVFRLSIIFVLVCSFIFTILQGNASTRDPGQNLPLMIFGMSLIMCILIFVEGKTAALLLSITLVGTVVAREEFIIKITHMFRSDPGQLDIYMQDYKQRTEVPNVVSFSKRVEKEISSSLGDQIKDEEKEQIIRIITEAQLASTLDRIRGAGNVRLLSWFEEDRREWLQRSRSLEGDRGFDNDVRVLVREGAIDCTLGKSLANATELAKCKLTPLGQELVDLPEKRLQACLSRIPSDASDGQRMLAEITCERDVENWEF